MSAQNLAVVIGPSLFRVNSTPEGLETQTKANELAKKFILNYAIYFTNVPKENIDSKPRKVLEKNSPKVCDFAELDPNQCLITLGLGRENFETKSARL